MKEMWTEISTLWRKQAFWKQALAFIFGSAVVISIFVQPDGMRNLILLLAGFIGWYFLARRTKAAERNVEIAEQGLTVDRLTRATEQLDSKNSSVRLGGILGLEQIANTQEGERKKIARIIISFIHARATKGSEEVKKDLAASRVAKLETEEEFSAYRAQRLDVEAAVNALAHIALQLEKQKRFREQHNEKKQHLCDLQNIDLRGLRFVEANLSNFEFAGADMSGAWLAHANFMGSNFCKCDPHGKEFMANLTGAFLDDANLRNTWLIGVNLSDTELERADFSNALLGGAIFDGANTSGANFDGCEDLEQEQIDKMHYFSQPPHLPDGLKPPKKQELPLFRGPARQ